MYERDERRAELEAPHVSCKNNLDGGWSHFQTVFYSGGIASRNFTSWNIKLARVENKQEKGFKRGDIDKTSSTWS